MAGQLLDNLEERGKQKGGRRNDASKTREL